MNDKLKKIIFKKLYSDLGHAEIIIDDHNSIWFINRNEKYWLLELRNTRNLWWRYQFFSEFFKLFSLKQSDYEPLIVEWVEEVINGKVVSSRSLDMDVIFQVEEVLNGKVVSSLFDEGSNASKVEEVLNGGVVSSHFGRHPIIRTVEEVLNEWIVSSVPKRVFLKNRVEEALNGRVVTSNLDDLSHD